MTRKQKLTMNKSAFLRSTFLLFTLLLPLFAVAEWHEEMGLTQTFVNAPVFQSEMRVYLSPTKIESLPSIVLVHGVGGSAEDFTDIIPLLKNRFNLIVFDLPGYGESNQSTATYSPSNYAKNLTHILPDLISPINYVIGHSMGGNISLQLAALAPDLVDKLILIDPAGMLNKFSYSKYVALNQVDEVPFVSEKNRKRFSRFIDSINNYIPDFSDLLLSKPSRKYLFNNNSTYISAISVMDEDLTEILRQVDVQTLIIWGEIDPVMPYQAGFMLDSVLENSTLKLIPEAGHSPQREFPNKVLDEIDTFVSKTMKLTKPSVLHPSQLAKESIFELDCGKSTKRFFNEIYAHLTIRNCDNVSLDKLHVGTLYIENSTVSLNYLKMNSAKGAAITAVNSNVTIWGGDISALNIVDLTHTYLDLNGVEMKATNEPFITDVKSQILASVSLLENNHVTKPLHGFVVKQKD